MGYEPLPQPVTRTTHTTRIELGPDAERLFQRTLAEVRASRKRRSWWRTLLWCWALRRRGFWRDRFWRCGSCGRAWPQAREECPCALQGPYRSPMLWTGVDAVPLRRHAPERPRPSSGKIGLG